MNKTGVVSQRNIVQVHKLSHFSNKLVKCEVLFDWYLCDTPLQCTLLKARLSDPLQNTCCVLVQSRRTSVTLDQNSRSGLDGLFHCLASSLASSVRLYGDPKTQFRYNGYCCVKLIKWVNKNRDELRIQVSF